MPSGNASRLRIRSSSNCNFCIIRGLSRISFLQIRCIEDPRPVQCDGTFGVVILLMCGLHRCFLILTLIGRKVIGRWHVFCLTQSALVVHPLCCALLLTPMLVLSCFLLMLRCWFCFSCYDLPAQLRVLFLKANVKK